MATTILPNRADIMFSNEFMEMRPIDGKGLGLVAIKSIPCGTRILSEEPMLRIDLVNGSMADVTNLIETQLDRMSPAQRNAYLRLKNAEDPDYSSRAYGIFVTNALPVRTKACEHSNLVLEICSRINHSCVPTADHFWDDDRGKMHLHTVHAIQPGDEITIDYFGNVAREVREWRMLIMGFFCKCAICTLPRAELKSHENRRREITALKDRLNSLEDATDATHPGPNPPTWAHLRVCRHMLDLLREQGIIHQPVVHVYRYAYRRAVQHASATRARVFASRAYARAVVLLGEDQPLVQMLKLQKEDPTRDMLYALAVAAGIPEEQPGEVRDVEDPDFEDWLWMMDRESLSRVMQQDPYVLQGALVPFNGSR